MTFTGRSFAGSQQGVDNRVSHPFDCITSLTDSSGANGARFLIEMAEIYAASGQKDKALLFLSQAVEVTESLKRQKHPLIDDPEEIALKLAFAHTMVGQYDQALGVVSALSLSMKARGLSELGAIMAKEGQRSQALELLSQARGLIKSSDKAADTLSEIATTYAKMGEQEEALRTTRLISNKEPYVKAASLATIASEFALAGQKEKALEVLYQAIQSAEGINDPSHKFDQKAEAFALIAGAYDDAGMREKALRLLLQASGFAKKAEINNVALRKIAGAYAKIGEYEQAGRIAASIKHSSSESDALIDIARACLNAGQKQQALENLEEAFQIVRSFKGEPPSFEMDALSNLLIEFVNAEQHERALDVLLYTLQKIRAKESKYSPVYELSRIARACAVSGLIPDSRASEILKKICDREPIPATPEEEEKRRLVEEVADRFIDRWHETLDLNVLFDEMYVSNPQQRRQNMSSFYGDMAALGIDKAVDEKVMRAVFMAFWNWLYLKHEYQYSHFKDDDVYPRDYPADIVNAEKEIDQMRDNKEKMSLELIRQFTAKANQASAIYRKYLPPEIFKTSLYQKNIKERAASEAENRKPFRIMKGSQAYEIKDDVEVYELWRGIFRFRFIREGGQLKVLTLDFEM